MQFIYLINLMLEPQRRRSQEIDAKKIYMHLNVNKIHLPRKIYFIFIKVHI